jgi:hypothetical protein
MRIIAFGLLVIALAFAYWEHGKWVSKPHYVKSEACQGCHTSHWESWRQTMHPWQFRPVQSPEDIKGDFTSNDPALTFRKEDVEFVIGNKWEQVYGRKIDGEYYPLTAKWMILAQKWVPYKVDDWKQTPMSEKCNGCHTTGFNPETYEFSEYGIGCEACHGPGSQHVSAAYAENDPWCTVCHKALDEVEDDIIVSLKSGVCGQCHSRGKQSADKEHIQTTFNFPLNYKPGDEISAKYKQVAPTLGKNTSYWWGEGISKKRHQEYADFARSKHAKSLVDLREKQSDLKGPPEDSCLECHSTDYRMAKDGHKPTLTTAKEGITCVTCHEPHGIDRYQMAGSAGAYRCGECHMDMLAAKTAESGKSHYPCTPGKVGCATCPMSYKVAADTRYAVMPSR